MRKASFIPFVFTTLLVGCVHTPVSHKFDDHALRVVSVPKVSLKADPLERIESVEVVMNCGRFVSLNKIPNDWSAQVISPVSGRTILRMEAGHGISELCSSSELNGFVTVLICEPSCFDITVSLSISSYDNELHERKLSFTNGDLLMEPLSNSGTRRTH